MTYEEPSALADSFAREVVHAAVEVHRALGPGYLETVYEEALAVELTTRDVSFVRQVTVSIDYKGHSVGGTRLDLLVGGVLVVELKAVEQLAPIHTAQVLSYLKATNLELALLLNFNVPRLKDGGLRRVVRTQDRPRRDA